MIRIKTRVITHITFHKKMIITIPVKHTKKLTCSE